MKSHDEIRSMVERLRYGMTVPVDEVVLDAADMLESLMGERGRYRAAMEQAVEALEKTMRAWSGTCAWHGDVKEALTALRTLLEETK